MLSKLKNAVHDLSMGNVIYSLAGKIMAMALLILLDIFIARILTINDYAEWAFFFSILSMMFYFCRLGINVSTKIFIAKQQTRESINLYISAAMRLRIKTSILIGTIILFISQFLAQNLGYPTKYEHLNILMYIAGILAILNSFTEFFKEIFIGLNYFKELCVITILEYCGYLIGGAFWAFIFKSTVGIAIGYITSGIIVCFLELYLLRKKGFTYIYTPKSISFIAKDIFKYALPMAVISFGGFILIELDTLMLGLLSTKYELSIYSIAKKICSKAAHVNYALALGVMTSFSIITPQNREEKKHKFYKISTLNTLIIIFISLLIYFGADFSIYLFYGKQYINAALIMKLLIPYYILFSISNLYSGFLDFQKKGTFRCMCYLTVILLNTILNYILIPIYGAKGAAIATAFSLLPYTIFMVIATKFIFCKK